MSDQRNPQAAAKLRRTLEREYASVTMPDWDKAQITKLLAQATKGQISLGESPKTQAANAKAEWLERERFEHQIEQKRMEDELREWYRKHPR